MLEKSAIAWRNNPVYLAAVKYLTSQRKPSITTTPSEAWYKSEIASPWGVTYFTFFASTRIEAYAKARNWACRVADQIKAKDPTRVIPYTLFLTKSADDNVVLDFCADITFMGWYIRGVETGSAEPDLVIEEDCE